MKSASRSDHLGLLYICWTTDTCNSLDTCSSGKGAGWKSRISAVGIT